VTVPADDVRDAEEREARRYASKVRLPGFRPGKAPAAVVRKRFAEATANRPSSRSSRRRTKRRSDESSSSSSGSPHVHDLKFEEGKPLTFELHLEVRPDVALARVAGFGLSGHSEL